ncbi:MAG: hypothetical protein KGJ62_05410 [Armatimonadetes bacterium]|nr:hypothetical protein [Armatimonadota bacterium]MDE2206640.1 hypothetical protein [Armatimonadota bacterium]
MARWLLALSTGLPPPGRSGADSTADITLRGHSRALLLFLDPPQDPEDGYRWIRMAAAVESIPLTASAGTYTTVADLEMFCQDLAEVMATLSGAANLEALDGGCEISVELGPSGRGTISGSIGEMSDDGFVVKFAIATDLTFLREPMTELKAWLNHHAGPV